MLIEIKSPDDKEKWWLGLTPEEGEICKKSLPIALIVAGALHPFFAFLLTTALPSFDVNIMIASSVTVFILAIVAFMKIRISIFRKQR